MGILSDIQKSLSAAQLIHFLIFSYFLFIPWNEKVTFAPPAELSNSRQFPHHSRGKESRIFDARIMKLGRKKFILRV